MGNGGIFFGRMVGGDEDVVGDGDENYYCLGNSGQGWCLSRAG